MYKYILFILINIFISLIYLKRKSKEKFFTVTPNIPIHDNQVFMYNLNEKGEDINIDNKPIKVFDFIKGKNSKIIIHTVSQDYVDAFFITFYASFNSNSDKSEYILNSKSVNNSKTNWVIYKVNNIFRIRVNGKDHSLNIIPKYKENHYNFFTVIYKNNKLLFYVDGEQSNELILDTNPERKYVLTFGGDNSYNLDSETSFSGKIGGISFGFYPITIDEIYKKFELKCKFYPHGDRPERCETLCEVNNGCDTFQCKQICSQCDDPENCKWVKVEKQKEPTSELEPPNPIRVISGNKSLLVEFKRPSAGTKGRIISYIITAKESYHNNNNNNNEQQIYNLEANDCSNCQFELTNLKNSIYYDISVKSQNEVIDGTNVIKNNISSKCSNTEIIAPIGPINGPDFHPALIESNEELRHNSKILIDGSKSCKDRVTNTDSVIDGLDIDKYTIEGIYKNLKDSKESKDKTIPSILPNTNTDIYSKNYVYDFTYDDKYNKMLFAHVDQEIINYLD